MSNFSDRSWGKPFCQFNVKAMVGCPCQCVMFKLSKSICNYCSCVRIAVRATNVLHRIINCNCPRFYFSYTSRCLGGSVHPAFCLVALRQCLKSPL